MTNDAVSSVVSRFYQLLSFEAGGAPRWNDMKELFHSGAIVVPPVSDTHGASTALSFNDFVSHFEHQFDKLRTEGFIEREVFESTSVFGATAQRLSAYEIRSAEHVVPFRGVNMFQLVCVEKGWKIASLIWDRVLEGSDA